jgi:hypothetical protein
MLDYHIFRVGDHIFRDEDSMSLFTCDLETVTGSRNWGELIKIK